MPATPDDFASIYRLCEATMRGYVEADFGDCFEQVAHKNLNALLAKGLFSTVHVNGQCVGALAVDTCATHVQLEELYVALSQQNQGLGAAILHQVMSQAAALGRPMRLHVLASNQRARAFYERWGFVATREAPHVTYLEWNAALTSRPPAPAPAGSW